MRAALLLIVAAGCGRLGFGEPADAALGDGMTGDAAGDAAEVACSPAFELCDGFEANTLDSTIWTAGAMVTLDSTRAHRGTRSVHVHMPALAAGTNSYQTLNETRTVTSGATTFWIRGWFWLSALPAGANGMELISAERPSTAGDYVFVFSDSTHIYTQFANASRTAMTTVPIGSWFCVIFKVVRSTGATGLLALSGDAPALTLANVQTDAAPPMTVVTIGIGFSAGNVPVPQPALDLWVDDVIAHPAPVTCAD